MLICCLQENDTYWLDVMLPTVPSEQFHQEMTYTIYNLDPASQYEAKVLARNRFGWNHESESFKFSTRGSGELCENLCLEIENISFPS